MGEEAFGNQGGSVNHNSKDEEIRITPCNFRFVPTFDISYVRKLEFNRTNLLKKNELNFIYALIYALDY